MHKIVPVLILFTAVSGCAVLDRVRPAPSPVSAPEPTGTPSESPAVLGQGTTAAALDQTTVEERAAALAAPAASAERSLGKVSVSLGSPAEQGFWLRSGIVTAAGKGRVVTAGGQSVAVDLIPGEGAAQLSLAAFRALGLSLTDLPEVSVYAQ